MSGTNKPPSAAPKAGPGGPNRAPGNKGAPNKPPPSLRDPKVKVHSQALTNVGAVTDKDGKFAAQKAHMGVDCMAEDDAQVGESEAYLKQLMDPDERPNQETMRGLVKMSEGRKKSGDYL